jgi:hypothetical protein
MKSGGNRASFWGWLRFFLRLAGMNHECRNNGMEGWNSFPDGEQKLAVRQMEARL